jgi:hypothetical protein
MKNFLTTTNTSSAAITPEVWFNYEEQRYLPAFRVAFPGKPLVIAKIELLGKEGKHYEYNSTSPDEGKPGAEIKYEVYFVPLPKILIPLNGMKLVLFTERYLAALVPKKGGSRLELTEVVVQEKLSYLDFAALSNLPATPLLFAGRAFVVEEKYLYFLLVKPQAFLSKPDFEKFIASFEIEKTSL